MKYIKKFNSEKYYNNFLDSDDYKRPNVSAINNAIINYNELIEQDKLTLIHYWDASDIKLGENWKDKVSQKELWKKTEINVINGYAEMSTDNYCWCNPVNLYLGDVWEVEVKFIVNNIPDKTICFVDFGAFIQASHGFGINITAESYLTVNPKLESNDTALYDIIIPFDKYGVPIKVALGMKRYNDTHNQFYVYYNNQYYYAPNLVLRQYATFDNNFNSNNFYIGKGTIDGTQYQSGDKRYIKYVKIFRNI